MADISTNYMGLALRNPVIVGSSGMTGTISGIKQACDNNAGAIVLKSIFEEQILHEMEGYLDESQKNETHAFHQGYNNVISDRDYDYQQAYAYLKDHAKDLTLRKYLNFVEEAKKSVDIPVIASINCGSAYDWHYFARRIEEAGADAIELNVFVLPSNTERSAEENEKLYFSIVEAVKKQVKIPVSLKLGYYFSGLTHSLVALSRSGVDSMVLFNRPFHPDINIDTFEIHPKYLLSDASEYSHVLRWMALLSGRVSCPLVATTGIHTYESAVKQLLAGATAVQVVSAIYKHGYSEIAQITEGIASWMDSKGFKTLNDFRGKMSQQNIKNPADFERVQFMRLYSEIV
jgi:dihydroorotate dehydrogenase (fumarate)